MLSVVHFEYKMDQNGLFLGQMGQKTAVLGSNFGTFWAKTVVFGGKSGVLVQFGPLFAAEKCSV